MTLRAHVDSQLDREAELINKVGEDTATLLREQMTLLRTLRTKLDTALVVRESEIKVPF